MNTHWKDALLVFRSITCTCFSLLNHQHFEQHTNSPQLISTSKSMLTKNLNARSILFTCDRAILVAGLYQVVTYQAATVSNKMNYLACDRSWLWAVENGKWFQMGPDPTRPMSCYWVLLCIESGDMDHQEGRDSHRITWATWLVRYRKGGCLTEKY